MGGFPLGGRSRETDLLENLAKPLREKPPTIRYSPFAIYCLLHNFREEI